MNVCPVCDRNEVKNNFEKEKWNTWTHERCRCMYLHVKEVERKRSPRIEITYVHIYAIEMLFPIQIEDCFWTDGAIKQQCHHSTSKCKKSNKTEQKYNSSWPALANGMTNGYTPRWTGSLATYTSLYLFHFIRSSLSLLWMRSSGWVLMCLYDTHQIRQHALICECVCVVTLRMRSIVTITFTATPHARPLLRHPFTKWRKELKPALLLSAWIVFDRMSNFVFRCSIQNGVAIIRFEYCGFLQNYCLKKGVRMIHDICLSFALYLKYAYIRTKLSNTLYAAHFWHVRQITNLFLIYSLSS